MESDLGNRAVMVGGGALAGAAFAPSITAFLRAPAADAPFDPKVVFRGWKPMAAIGAAVGVAAGAGVLALTDPDTMGARVDRAVMVAGGTIGVSTLLGGAMAFGGTYGAASRSLALQRGVGGTALLLTPPAFMMSATPALDEISFSD